MPESRLRFLKLRLENFKAFSDFTVNLNQFNILVGPNNAGKSTILVAFRILAAALRRASARRAEVVNGPNGQVYGHVVALNGLSIADENIFHNYDDANPAKITFFLSNQNCLVLYFSEAGSCVLIPQMDDGRQCQTPAMFRANFDCSIGFVPILGPVEHNEIRYEKEAARLALFNYGAARNFRNIWYHFPEKFQDFRGAIQKTWPGMDVEPPEANIVDGKLRLFMYCPEQRMPREIFWSGFGFQVWCQMLTHLIQSDGVSLFLIDEPDIYLHSDLQRQLLSMLRAMDSDVLIATHSTEILTEAEYQDLVIINKDRKRSARVKSTEQLFDIFQSLGSNLNPVLTQIARTRRVVFVEGKDFQLLGRFAEKAGYIDIAARRKFAVVPTEGFNPQKVKNLVAGFEAALGFAPKCACIFDRDFRSDAEVGAVSDELSPICDFVHILEKKEIENYLLHPSSIRKAAERRIFERVRRGGSPAEFSTNVDQLLESFAGGKKSYVCAQAAEFRKTFERRMGTGLHDATLTQEEFERIQAIWSIDSLRLVPGKEAFSFLNNEMRAADGINVTAFGVVDAMSKEDISSDLITLFDSLAEFTQ